MSYELYKRKVFEDVKLLMTSTSFKSRNMKKIDLNIENINKMIFENQIDNNNVAKCLKFHQKSLLVQRENLRSWLIKSVDNKEVKLRLKSKDE